MEKVNPLGATWFDEHNSATRRARESGIRKVPIRCQKRQMTPTPGDT